MQYLKDLPADTIWPHLIDAIKSAAENEIREYANSRASDVKRGAETPELAAAFIDKFAAGMTRALHVVGIDTDVTRIADASAREIDPNFEEHRTARWAARPAELTYGLPLIHDGGGAR